MIVRITYLTTLAAVLSTVVLFVLTHVPHSYLAHGMIYNDKLMHYIAYSVVSFLYGISFSPKGKKGLLGLLIVAVMVSILAAIDEYTQQFFGRNTDIQDYYADLYGIATGIGVSFIVWLIKTAYGIRFNIHLSR